MSYCMEFVLSLKRFGCNCMYNEKMRFQTLKHCAYELVWDECGATSAYELILLSAIVVFGSMIGLVSIRDHIAQECGDIGVALTSLDQSFSYAITVTPPMPLPSVVVASGGYVDIDDLGLTDPGGAAPAGLVFGPAHPGGGLGEDTPSP